MNDLVMAEEAPCCEAQTPSILKRLTTRKLALQRELEKVDAALAVCEKNPELEQAVSAWTQALGNLTRPY